MFRLSIFMDKKREQDDFDKKIREIFPEAFNEENYARRKK